MSLSPTYADQRDDLNQAMAGQAPPELLNGFAAAAAQLDAVDFAARAPQVGDAAPDFTLPDQDGEDLRLSQLLEQGPVVLIFYRGEWCPYCNLQLRTFQARLPEIAAVGGRLIAISPQTRDHSVAMANKNDLGFPVLSDVEGEVIELYGLRYEVDAETRKLYDTAGNDLAEYNGQGGWILPAAATFVIGTDGRVRYANVRGDWRERAEPDDVLAVLKSER
jgi:peroxiredoxin